MLRTSVSFLYKVSVTSTIIVAFLFLYLQFNLFLQERLIFFSYFPESREIKMHKLLAFDKSRLFAWKVKLFLSLKSKFVVSINNTCANQFDSQIKNSYMYIRIFGYHVSFVDGYFVINKTTGILKTPGHFDYEHENHYTVEIVVRFSRIFSTKIE